MKKKITKIWGVGLVVVLVASLLLSAAPVSAGTISWGAETIPTTSGKVLGPANVDIRDMAVAADGTTIYAVPGSSITDNVTYKSTNGGETWTSITSHSGIRADLVAVAPDDADIVAIANIATPVVYITTNGGTTWGSLGTIQQSGADYAAASISDIALSAAKSGTH